MSAKRKPPKIEVFVDFDKFQGERVFNEIMEVIEASQMSIPALIGTLEKIKLSLLLIDLEDEEHTDTPTSDGT